MNKRINRCPNSNKPHWNSILISLFFKYFDIHMFNERSEVWLICKYEIDSKHIITTTTQIKQKKMKSTNRLT